MDTGTTQQQNSFSDEETAARLAAETKKLTLTPLSNSVQVDSISDEQLVAQHTSGPALANTSTDTEQTRPKDPASAQAPSDRRAGGHILAITLTGIVLLVAGGVLYLLTSPR